MAEKYEEGKDYLLPVKVFYSEGSVWPIRIIFNDGANKDCYAYIKDEPGLLLTTSEVAARVRYRRNIEQEECLAELETDYKDLKEKAKVLKAECDEWKKKYEDVYENNRALRTAIEELRKGWDKAQDKIALLEIINLTLAEKIEDLKRKE